MRMLPPDFSIGTDEDGSRHLPLCVVCDEVIDIFNTSVIITSPEEEPDHMFFYHTYHDDASLVASCGEDFPLHHIDTFTPPPSRN